MDFPIPVTMITSAEGTNISPFVTQLLHLAGSERVNAIVPRKTGKRRHQSPKPGMIQVPAHLLRGRPDSGCLAGCVCCTSRGDLTTTLKGVIDAQSVEHIVIQTIPRSHLPSLMEIFTADNESSSSVSNGIQLRTVANVVDGTHFLSSLKGRGARSLIERIEFANVVLVQGVSALEPSESTKMKEVLKALNPNVRIIGGDQSLTIEAIQAEHSFDLDAVKRQNSWKSLGLEDESRPPMVRFNYEGKRPFHPSRLDELLREVWPGVIRAKGVFWVATYPEFVCVLDTAGPSRKTSVHGQWCISGAGEEKQPLSLGDKSLPHSGEPKVGERRYAISMMGFDLDEMKLRSRFDACLLTDEELAAPERWEQFHHPFPWPERSG